MANIVLLTAGGVGSRTQMSIPKQFLTVKDKPIIVYTMEKFQKHPEIDAIAVVCLTGWENYLMACAKQFGISKLLYVFNGGNSGFESIKNGIDGLASKCDENDIVLIHDGNRPATGADIITDCITMVKEKGNVVTKIPTTEVVFKVVGNDSPVLLNRDELYRTQTPHGARLGFMREVYTKAVENGLENSVAFCSLLSKMNYDINFVNGNEKNFKITTKDDIDLFKGMINMEDK